MYFVHFDSQNATLQSLKQDILRAIAYFDIFSYPLRKEEIWQFLQHCGEKYEFEQALDELVSDGIISYSQGFYGLEDCITMVQRRLKGNAMAGKLVSRAHKIASFLAGFPYVRAIGISGSLSKNFADEKSDIDFFIITTANRLWIARTFMHFFKKLTFLAGKQHWFCMNYYVDEMGLQIREKNIFTAIETATVLPSQGQESFREFYLANSWVNTMFPNHVNNLSSSNGISDHLLKRFMEAVLNNRFGDWLDNQLQQITCRRWSKKTSSHKLNNRGIIMGLDAGKHYAKPDPNNFQVRVVEKYETKIQQLLLKFLSKTKQPGKFNVSFLKK